MEKEISQAVIRRMPRYYRYLGELLEEGVERISSNDLSPVSYTHLFQKPANVHTKNDTVTVGYFLGGGIQNSFNKESYPAFSGD